jgi:two-component system cell cycle response regulator
MENRSNILTIVSDPTFAKLERSVATDGCGPGRAPRYALVRNCVGDSPVGQAEAAVIEPACFPTFSAYQEAYRGLGIRVLVVVRDAHEESLAFAELYPNDDVIRVDALAEQFCLRLERVLLGKRTPRIDTMTGLSNRVALFELAEAVLAEGVDPDNPLSAVIVDLDHFKRINDAYGHQVGDMVLRAAASALAPSAHDALCLARYGGDEFLVLLRADRELARSRAEAFRAAIATLEPSPGLRFTASLGVATATMPVEFAKLVEVADRCLYAAKQHGRNCVFDLAEFGVLATSREEDPDLVDYDNRVRVLTDRLAEYLSQKGRKLARVFQDEAERDGLTGIYNRRYFDRRIARELELARRPDRPLSLLLFDLDDFGAINRTYGYPAGDRTLKAVTSAVAQSVRTTDWVARYGGEELCAVLPDTPLDTASAIAGRILAQIRLVVVVSVDGRTFGATASVGVVETRGEDAGVPEFVQRASDKLREAKKAGKNRVAR